MIDLLPILVQATATTRLQLKQWFSRYPAGMPWSVVSDYCIGDVHKGNDVFSFVIVAPHDTTENICEYIAGAAPKDLKNTNKVPLGLVQYLACEVPVTFSVSFVMRRDAALLRNYLSVEAMSALVAGAISFLDDRLSLYQDARDIDYQNVQKKSGVKKLTPARAMIAGLVQRYWVMGMECSMLEIQKLAWFLQRVIESKGLRNELKLHFEANYYGPYANNLDHLLNALDGSYLKAEKRIPDCNPLDVIAFDDSKKEYVEAFLNSEGKDYLPAMEKASEIINGFESPYGLELLSTVDWLLVNGGCEFTVESIRAGMTRWPAGKQWADRKLTLFDDKSLQIAIERLKTIAL